MDRRPDALSPADAPPIRVLGEVAWFCEDRGFGFVRPDDGGRGRLRDLARPAGCRVPHPA